MTDISVSERRLSAALDRIDQLLEAGLSRRDVNAGSSDEVMRAQLDAALTENARMKQALSDAASSAPAADGERLVAATEQATRLAAANDDLAAANRILIEAAAGEGDRVEAVSLALEAEIEALRAARAAEIAQLGDIMQELERLMADNSDARDLSADMDGGN